MFRRPRAGAEEAERGFTLVELMCVVLILALLMAIGLPTWTAARTRASDSAARAVLTESHHALKVVMADYRDLSTLTHRRPGRGGAGAHIRRCHHARERPVE